VEHVTTRFDERGEIALDQLVLERERGGGHHDATVVQQRGHQVAQRLARAGPGLHQQVDPVLQSRGDHLRHLDLSGPLLAAQRVDRGGEDLANLGADGAGPLDGLLGHRQTLAATSDERAPSTVRLRRR
jgi:hypothetical protein